MKRIIMLIIYSLFIVDCAPTLSYPKFEDSNQHFIEKVIKKLDIGKELEGKIDSTDRIAFFSIEKYESLEKPIIAMIEDQVISSLIKSGYTLVERDPEAIQKLIREGEEKYYITFNKPSEKITYDQITGDALDPGMNFIVTRLSSADIAIFYRILEIGFLYRKYPEDKEYDKREGLVSLHIRVQDVQNGEILHATNLTSKLTDVVKKNAVEHLASFHYTFFPYEYPIQNKEK